MISYPDDEVYTCDCKEKDCFVCGWCDHDKGTLVKITISKPTKFALEMLNGKMTQNERKQKMMDTEMTVTYCRACGEALFVGSRKVPSSLRPQL